MCSVGKRCEFADAKLASSSCGFWIPLCRFDVPTTVKLLLNGSGAVTGQQTAHVWSSWVSMTGDTATVTATGSTGTTRLGAQTKFIEYRRYSPGAIPTSIPFRFPGQFFDSETDLFENWNRYYDPNSGQYLQPEPSSRTRR